jgi:hypothetical protein
MKITEYILERYPRLIPTAYKDETDRYLHQLHDINYFSLSFSGKPQIMQQVQAKIRTMMHETESTIYRKALDYKLSM